MAEKDTGEPDESSLELPSLFGRKKKRGSRVADDAPAEAAAPEPATAPVAPEEPPAPEPAPPAESLTERIERVEPMDPRTDEPTRPVPSVGAAEPAPPRTQEHTAVSPEPDPSPAREPAIPVGGARKAEKPRRERSTPSVPTLGASVATLVVGALVGLLGAALTFASLQACNAVTGTQSCGGPGLLLVLAVVVVMILAGSALLRMFGVTESGGLSFLGVAIFVAICLVFLLQQLLEPWMVVVGPVLCALSYGTAYWVVTRFNTELLEDEQPEAHDVR